MSRSMKKTGNRYLIDTKIIIDLFGNDKGLLIKLSAENIIIPSVVVGELYFGAYASSGAINRIKEVTEFIRNFEVINTDKETAHFYGQIKAQLKRSGTPIPENDIWISALSMQYSNPITT